jgi:cytochrome c oxidase subunit 2
MFNTLSQLFTQTVVFNDVPEPLQIGFQDGASPGYTGIIALHDSIFFYLVLISVGVF